MSNENVLELISTVDELLEVHEFLKDDNVDRALSNVVKLMMNPEIPSAKALPLIIELQAIAGVCSVKATWYATVAKDRAGTANNSKKNIYYTLADVLDKIVSALKYSAKTVY